MDHNRAICEQECGIALTARKRMCHGRPGLGVDKARKCQNNQCTSERTKILAAFVQVELQSFSPCQELLGPFDLCKQWACMPGGPYWPPIKRSPSSPESSSLDD